MIDKKDLRRSCHLSSRREGSSKASECFFGLEDCGVVVGRGLEFDIQRVATDLPRVESQAVTRGSRMVRPRVN